MGVACAACFEALAYVFASADASLRILMIPRQKTSDSWLMCASSNMTFHCQGVRKSWRYFIHAPQLAKYARPAPQKVAQANPKGLLHLFALALSIHCSHITPPPQLTSPAHISASAQASASAPAPTVLHKYHCNAFQSIFVPLYDFSSPFSFFYSLSVSGEIDLSHWLYVELMLNINDL